MNLAEILTKITINMTRIPIGRLLEKVLGIEKITSKKELLRLAAKIRAQAAQSQPEEHLSFAELNKLYEEKFGSEPKTNYGQVAVDALNRSQAKRCDDKNDIT